MSFKGLEWTERRGGALGQFVWALGMVSSSFLCKLSFLFGEAGGVGEGAQSTVLMKRESMRGTLALGLSWSTGSERLICFSSRY